MLEITKLTFFSQPRHTAPTDIPLHNITTSWHYCLYQVYNVLLILKALPIAQKKKKKEGQSDF